MPLYEYECPNGHVTEHLATVTNRAKPHYCNTCGLTAEYKISAPTVKLEGITGAFPGAYDRWEKVRKQKLEQERKKNN